MSSVSEGKSSKILFSVLRSSSQFLKYWCLKLLLTKTNRGKKETKKCTQSQINWSETFPVPSTRWRVGLAYSDPDVVTWYATRWLVSLICRDTSGLSACIQVDVMYPEGGRNSRIAYLSTEIQYRSSCKHRHWRLPLLPSGTGRRFTPRRHMTSAQ